MNSHSSPEPAFSESSVPSNADKKRWRQYLADEQAEAATYRYLAERRDGEERDILLALAEAEGRHEEHWRTLLGDDAGRRARASFRNRVLGLLARRFGSVFVLALAQRAEGRSPYAQDPNATSAMAADEQIHEEVIRGLATRGRTRLSGNFRAAVFGANDGLVSNLALIMGIGATGVSSTFILISGLAGLLAGALSMGAGEYVSVRSQRELLEASRPTQITLSAAKSLDIDANELVLVYRARGMTKEAAEHRAAERMGLYSCDCDPSFSLNPEADAEEKRDEHESVGTGLGAAASSFCFFASGAVIPVLPYLFGLTGMTAVVLSCVLVGLALLMTGAVVGLLSGASPLKRALRQLAIGLGAAGATYLLGMVFGTTAL
ncbi:MULTISPECIES: VIT1/CCC1 family protein [unclassified Arthrobacter]|uniref:VIT1/CCC1 transporter family protein n=1 Tax=unclassified Arthrobacter TaxID=235627 RepID=UPI001D14D6C2|nr:VIT1/CCC1 family protein [Arthrobacter sp. zg-Y1110]MCC3291691.1 VIT1/CCC1 family protein [Arthrobacter sp. zg-Y1110]MCC3302067.1 VIT1/CCC1 family protein [Arthrobacter sp. zg-Y895]UWX85534.1 VIT1/CCC1 family protein [Arthrobacter sp. zg-Y1110]